MHINTYLVQRLNLKSDTFGCHFFVKLAKINQNMAKLTRFLDLMLTTYVKYDKVIAYKLNVNIL